MHATTRPIAEIGPLDIVDATERIETGKTVAVIALIVSVVGFVIYGFAAIVIGGSLALLSCFLSTQVPAYALRDTDRGEDLYTHRDRAQVDLMKKAIETARAMATDRDSDNGAGARPDDGETHG